MKALLVIVSFISSGGTDVEPVPYADMKVCETAATTINDSDFDRGLMSSMVVAICVPKEAAE